MDLSVAERERRQKYLKTIFKDVRHTDHNVNVILGLGGYVVNKEVSNDFKDVFLKSNLNFFFF
jgi:uncharacterized protein YnzC (UPF0291/DUF896 family)